jgi:guanylate kinase
MDARKLIIVTAPTCGGKTETAEAIAKGSWGQISKVITSTTRGPRDKEIPDVHYHFYSAAKFALMGLGSMFLETARHGDHHYGTERSEVEKIYAMGKIPIMNLELQGIRKLRPLFPQMLAIFLMPGSLEELEVRLRNRGTHSDEDIAKRLAIAEREMSEWKSCCDVVISSPNGTLPRTIARTNHLVEGYLKDAF